MKEERAHITIKAVAEMVGVNEWTIRFWVDRLGVLKPHRDEDGNLFFTPEDVEKINIICTLSQKRGMKLKEVRKYLSEAE